MRRMLVILKHSSALPAQLFDEKESAVTLGCQFGARQEEKKSRCCVQNSTDAQCLPQTLPGQD